ncbi:MAG: NADH-quinone oxidoreductase subunit A [Rhodothermaeota bacterium MED-G64]|jgi:NADH-quinone oxidoreductase subunit A|nr:NADH-quinone oxidoreductase subunit A [Bacteroidota bacterium]MDA0906795.1 NADH-quinone oxidoreductase subunit A [Bacteroidota bacterium]RCL68206.1 MAG: NADH-quinone oxidoreductase subunit A [Rhodothermaeota bacterium MED-G64]RPF79879.1 MAG: NADH-quinone oxidoreductase subunit A [Rhodothermaceae bacterium TMED105]|tara:strand:- start:6608 stop:6994 length:387 start_codon:yes stop_codon:yes gene_type:complete
MLETYLPVVLLAAISLTIALIFMTLSRVMGPYRPNKVKLTPYESGMDPIGEAKERYSISYYLVAMEFIVFDLEVMFLYPWVVRYLDLGFATFVAVIVFITVLFLGLLYTLKKGTLDFSSQTKVKPLWD